MNNIELTEIMQTAFEGIPEIIYLRAVGEMIAYFFAVGHYNYANRWSNSQTIICMSF